DLPVGDADLIRIFNLQTNAPPIAEAKPRTVMMFEGLDHHSDIVFSASGERSVVLQQGQSTRVTPASGTVKSKDATRRAIYFSVPGSKTTTRCPPGKR